MNKLLLAITFVLIFAACIVTKEKNTETQATQVEKVELIDSSYSVQHTTKLKSIINFCIINWESLYNNSGIKKGYVENVGVRGRYGMLKNSIGVSVLESLFGEDVFVSGPHQNGMNYNSNTFGRYNSKFIARVFMEFKEMFKDKGFINSTQQLYDSQLKRYLRTYYISYPIAANNRTYIYNYEQEAFRGFAERIEKEGYNVYEGFTCPGFWVRRSLDGTSNDFFKLLKLTMHAYDKEFLLKNRIKQIERPESFDDYQQSDGEVFDH